MFVEACQDFSVFQHLASIGMYNICCILGQCCSLSPALSDNHTTSYMWWNSTVCCCFCFPFFSNFCQAVSLSCASMPKYRYKDLYFDRCPYISHTVSKCIRTESSSSVWVIASWKSVWIEKQKFSPLLPLFLLLAWRAPANWPSISFVGGDDTVGL